MGTLYVLEPDVYVSREGGVLRVSRRAGREVLLERPLMHVSEVVIFGNAVVTPSVIRACIEQGTALHYLTKGGGYVAQIAPLENKNVQVRIAQYAAYLDAGRKLTVAKQVVLGKVQNALVFAKRNGADPAELVCSLTSVRRCKDVEGLRGTEGNAARHYFSLIRHKFPPEFQPEGRSKRPPRDPANSLLSLTYTFLAKECVTAARIAGLDPYVGYLHEAKYGRPALALDLMEEFRAILADSVVLTLFNRGMITGEMFEVSRGYPTLTDEGFKQFLRAWEDRLSQRVRHPLLGQKLDYRQVLLAQARILGKHLTGELSEYVPFTVR